MSKAYVDLDRITDNPHQARLSIGDVEGLAETILKHGLRQLPEGRLLRDGHVVTGSLTTHTCREDGHWFLEDVPGSADTSVQLAAGHRRVEAVRLLNADDTVTDAELRDAGLVPGYVPVDLQRLSDEEMLDLLTVENAQREELSPIEQARLIGELAEAGRSGEEIAGRFGKSASWVSNRKRMLDLPEKVQVAVHEGQISARQGQALAKAYQLQGEKPDLVDDAVFELQPSTLAEDARQGASSERIREKVQTLEDTIESMESMRSDDDDDFSPDVGTTHPDAVGPEYPSKKTDQTDDPDRDREEAEISDVEVSGARETEDFSSGEVEAGDEDRSSQTDEDKTESAPTPGEAPEVSGDGAPNSDLSVTDTGGEPGELGRAIADVEQHGCDWELGTTGRGYYAYVQSGGTVYECTSAQTPAGALQSALSSALDETPDVGQVVPGQVDTLLSADGENMWDEDVASAATIASLLVAHRVAGPRQETWRTRKIADVVQRRVGTVTEEDVPEGVLADVEAEVERRLQVSGPEEPTEV